MTESELRRHPDFNYRWYHTLELLPDVWTDGYTFDNLVATRTLLDHVDVSGRNCLDVGAMEGLVSYLLERRGAGRVMAYDRSLSPRERISNGARFRLARRVLGSSVEFVYDVPFRNLHLETERKGIARFDVLIFSGVLYHMFDPLAALAQVRNLLRAGGVAILETAGILSEEPAMHANSSGRFYDGDDYWFISSSALEYWLRFLHLQPLDCCYVNHGAKDGLDVIRMAVLCRAVDRFVATPDDDWMRKQDQNLFAMDFAEYFRKEKRNGAGHLNVSLSISDRPKVWRDAERQILDLTGSLRCQQALSGRERPHLTRLALTDR